MDYHDGTTTFAPKLPGARILLPIKLGRSEKSESMLRKWTECCEGNRSDVPLTQPGNGPGYVFPYKIRKKQETKKEVFIHNYQSRLAHQGLVGGRNRSVGSPRSSSRSRWIDFPESKPQKVGYNILIQSNIIKDKNVVSNFFYTRM